MIKAFVPVLSLVLLATSASSARAYVTSFEEPLFTNESLDSQDGWLTTGSAWHVGPRSGFGVTIPTDARTGTQSTMWTNAFGNSSSFADQEFPTVSELSASVWIKVFQGTVGGVNVGPDTQNRYGLRFSPTESPFPTITIDGLGNVYGTNVFGSSDINLLGTIAPSANSWVQLTLTADGATGAVTASAGGVAFSLSNLTTANDTFRTATMYHQFTGSNAFGIAYFDDFSAAGPVPEPMSMTVLGLGVAALARRRRNRA